MSNTKRRVRSIRISDYIWDRVCMHRRIQKLSWDQLLERMHKADYQIQEKLKNKVK